MNHPNPLLFLLLAAACALGVAGCANEREVDAEPASDEVLFDTRYLCEMGFTDRDGYQCFSNIDPRGFPPGALCFALYSPAGNLKMVVACSAQAAYLTGYKIDYDEAGRVKEVIEVHDEPYDFSNLEDEENYFFKLDEIGDNNALLREWMKDKSCEGEHIVIERDENGIPVRIGDLDVPEGYSAKYSIERLGNWMTDTGSAYLQFVVRMEEQNKEGRSTVDYLYYDGKLMAELAYWNGVFIKALYYHNGHFDGINDDRNQDVYMEIDNRRFDGSQLKTPWYVDQN